jgi:N-formylglutamate deformylase
LVICIGTDDFHTPTVLKNKFLKQFRKKGYSVEFNRPFAGSIVPTKYYKINKNVFSIMIEINRKLYMNEQSIKVNSNFNIIQSDIREIIKDSTGNLEFS